jgi:tellurite resistance protein
MPRMPQVSFELFQTLLAIGWLDGELVEAERDAVLEAAVEAGLSESELQKLRTLAQSPVTFADMRFEHLEGAQRLLIYAVASWVAQADETISGEERAALHAMATLLTVTGAGRKAMDDLVAEVRARPDAPARLDIATLTERIAQRMGAG